MKMTSYYNLLQKKKIYYYIPIIPLVGIFVFLYMFFYYLFKKHFELDDTIDKPAKNYANYILGFFYSLIIQIISVLILILLC
jgi:hypothetical protein